MIVHLIRFVRGCACGKVCLRASPRLSQFSGICVWGAWRPASTLFLILNYIKRIKFTRVARRDGVQLEAPEPRGRGAKEGHAPRVPLPAACRRKVGGDF